MTEGNHVLIRQSNKELELQLSLGSVAITTAKPAEVAPYTCLFQSLEY